MPQFAPSEPKTAVAPITVMPAGLSCEAEIFLGPDDITKVVTSGRIPFTSTGASQDVRLPIAMPDTEGTYHVYVDVYVEGLLIAAYQAIEDVVIAAPAPPVALSPCVYCGATFTTEAELIGHMGSRHPGKPYLVSVYLPQAYVEQSRANLLNFAPIHVKLYFPGIRGGEELYYQCYQYLFYLDKTTVPRGDLKWKVYGGGPVMTNEAPGFYDIDTGIPSWGITGPPPQYVYLGLGTYPVYTACVFRRQTGPYQGAETWFYEDVDTGLAMEVV